MINGQVDFYFDFMSPYAYLAHHGLTRLADRAHFKINYRPVDLQLLKNAAGNTGPATRDIPPKIKYCLADIKRWARHYDIPWTLPASLDSGQANKGTIFAIQQGQARDYVTAVWAETYGKGGSMKDEELLAGVARSLGWSAAAFIDFIRSSAADDEFEAINKEAQRRGVFGVPTMCVGDEMWWGNDRLFFLAEHLGLSPTAVFE